MKTKMRGPVVTMARLRAWGACWSAEHAERYYPGRTSVPLAEALAASAALAASLAS